MVGLISYRYTLWDLSSELGGHLINDFLLSILYFPPFVLIYLTNYPVNQGIIKKVLYMSFWSLLSTTIEGIEYMLENIRYDHSWSLWKSLLFNLVLFPTLTIHHTRPLLAYVLFLIETILLISICGIPWSSFK